MTSLALALLLGAGAPAFAVDSGDIVVATVKGEVRVTMNGVARDVRAGSVLALPASVRTGRDGAIELKQGATSVSVGPDTQLEFPALEKRGAPVDRIVQPRGNAFYDIGKREGRKLRVETPYLVGVIKGTQFNVAAQEDSTTISLFEGRLEVRSSEDGDAVDLHAGEIASRRRGDESIGVIKMNEKAPAAAPVSRIQKGDGGVSGAEMPALPVQTRDGVDDNSQRADDSRTMIVVDDSTGAGVDVSSRDAVQGANGVDVNNGLHVDAVVSPPVDVGGSSVSVDVGAATDLAAGAITTTIDAAAGVDLGTSGIGVDVDAGVAAGVGDVLGADDDGNNGHGNDPGRSDPSNPGNSAPATPGNIVDDVGGLLDGLLRRPGRR